jgi:hypothetical protein
MSKLFKETGEYIHAEQFFRGILQDISVCGQPHRRARIHNDLGANYMHKGN